MVVMALIFWITILSAAIAMPSQEPLSQRIRRGLEPFNQIFRRLFPTLAPIELMGPVAAGVTVHLEQGAAPFAGQTGCSFFQFPADAKAACVFVHGKVADAGEVAAQRDLWDEVEGETAEDGVGRYVD